jgi:hypothetical protein
MIKSEPDLSEQLVRDQSYAGSKKDYTAGGRVLIVFDERPKAKIIQTLDEDDQ